MDSVRYLALLILAALSCASTVLAADFEDCASTKDFGEWSAVTVSGCADDDDKCPLIRGQNVSISIVFTPKKKFDAVQQIVHGEVLGIETPFPLENPSACENSNIQCPLEAGQQYTYEYGLYVKKLYPKVSVKVKWELKDGDGQQIICVLIPAVLR